MAPIDSMLKRILGWKPKQKNNDVSIMDKLSQALEDQEKREKVLKKKAAAELAKARQFSRTNNKRGAIQCLKLKQSIEKQIEAVVNNQLRIHDQIILLEGTRATKETVAALRIGASAMKMMQKETNIDDVDKTMDEINEQTDNLRQIQEILAQPVVDFDDTELVAELEDLEEELDALEGAEELGAMLLEPAASSSAATANLPTPPARPVLPQQRVSEIQELAALQAEMAL